MPTDPHRRPTADSVEATLAIASDRWSFLILREAFFGVRRFNDFQDNLGISRKVLSARLGTLTDEGIFERQQYQTRPVRHEYRLTDKGRDLYTVTVALMQWGDRWLMDRPPLMLEHEADGGEVEVVLRCRVCGEPLNAREVGWRANPAAAGHRHG